ncbi:ATP-dependent DNA helicase PcrA [Neochlamydia sp. TUME1]|jgi:DNA helicase-2/ATP-dependent DNA helicase PcrA|uniref:ATP-dependent helicase n=1 Tax=Neochlamydia sp. TUME1 TaxID=1478174 RepID=UPI00057D8AB3|nr:UvrD-helicase domain-containing protein [Neochlamydia sp. TUME1]KIC72314.1 ATP-dependent DNA helicase PcrA [Neochlamydia sp. TUME1]
MTLLSQLNEEQLGAVNAIEGPILVLAGAGSGKTRVVTSRIASLIEMGVPTSQILGLTFTNKAAEEMRERIRILVGRQAPLLCTFHSLGARILRESIQALGYERDFTIYDEEDIHKVLQACLAELEIKDKKMDTKTFRGLISKAKNALQRPEDIKVSYMSSPAEEYLSRVYSLYQTKLKHYNAVDFDDLLFLVVRLFQEHPDKREQYQDRWTFLSIDEYQDTNEAQYKILNYLVQKHGNLFVVGDPDQSIYSWRGANINNILNFEKDYPGAQIFRLQQNYRSCSNILEAANAVIAHNANRYEKQLWSDLGKGEKIKFYASDTERDEADFVADKIRQHREQGIPYNEIVVFYRTNNQSRAFEDYFLYRQIPYVIVGGLSFYQRREIKDILSFLRMVYSGTDYISFLRSLNIPRRGIGAATLEKIRLAASKEQLSILAYCEAIAEDKVLQHPIKLATKQKEALKQYLGIIYRLREVAKSASLQELVRAAIDETDYLQFLAEDPESFEDRKGNLDALITKAIEWEQTAVDATLRAFLEELTLKSSLDEADTKKDRVSLMTIHNGKGLEFKVVFLVGIEEDLFPHVNSKDKLEALEEERRLFYVGMTRAKECLYLTHSQYRYMWGMARHQLPSRFMREVPREYLERIHQSPLPTFRPKAYPEEKREPSINEGADQPFDHYEVGAAIFHQEFGIGIIREVYQSSLGLTYKIFFSKDNRERSIVAKYAKLKKL